MDKAHVLDNILRDWLGSVSYMSAQVAIQFPPRSGGGNKCKGDCRISKFNSKRGLGGGRGRGRGQGRGGCGGYHSGSNTHDPDNGWVHGVECSDFRRRFSDKKMDKYGSYGRLYIFNKRKSDKDTRQIQKVHQGRKYDGKELALVPYSEEATDNNNLE